MPQKDAGVQNFARSVQSRKYLRFLSAAVFLFISAGVYGCSSHPGSHAGTEAGIEADAVLFTGHSWTVFNFGARRYLQILKSSAGLNEDSLQPSHWLEISSPGGSFRPVQAVEAMQGNFYLIDAAQDRLCLYDSAAHLLSTFPLPGAIGNFNSGRMEAFRGGGGAFTFLDYQTGDTKQFVSRAGNDGGASWTLLSNGRLPIGLKHCVQELEGQGLSCILPEGPIRFDHTLNRIRTEDSRSSQARLTWEAAIQGWIMVAEGSDGKTLFQFNAEKRRLTVSGFSLK